MPMPSGSGGGFGSGQGPIRYGWTADPDVAEQGGYSLAGGRQQAGFQRQRDASQFGYQRGLAQQQIDAQAAQQAAQLGFGREQLAQQGALGRAQIDASLAPTRFAEQRFNTVFPLVQKQLGAISGGAGSGTAGYQGGGPVGQQPAISDAPVYSQDQIQQQVNATRAQNDQATAGKQRDAAQQMAGRGYGANSPLAMALNNSLGMNNLATNTGAEQDLRFKAASGNASQVLEAQKAKELQFANRQDEDIKRNQIYRNSQNALIASLLGSI